MVKQEYEAKMCHVLRQYQHAKRENMLLLLPFTTVNEYLFMLRAVAEAMKPLGENAMFYLAAAVSDFFVPRERLREHKIQSTSEEDTANGDDTDGAASTEKKSPSGSKKLIIDLDPVPKLLKRLVDGWAPEGSMIVSFKLETDPDLLIDKARQALERYAHHLVIGNLLGTRKWEVVFVSREGDGERWIRVPRERRSKSISGVENLVGRAGGGVDGAGDGQVMGEGMVEIESLIVPELVEMHERMIEKGGKT